MSDWQQKMQQMASPKVRSVDFAITKMTKQMSITDNTIAIGIMIAVVLTLAADDELPP